MATTLGARARWAIAAAALAGCTVADAAGRSYGCKSGVVTIGDPVFTIIEKCGTPQQTEVLSGGGADSAEEFWYYATSGKLPQLFHLRGGRLIAIERLRR